MPTPKDPGPRIVLPHRPLEKLEENLYAIEGEVPGTPGLRRRMTIVRRRAWRSCTATAA